MIDSLFIISAAGNFVVERHFRGNTPRHLCEPFMEKLRSCERLEEVPGLVCGNRRHVLVHILREKMVLLAVVTQEEPPLAVFELLDRVYRCFRCISVRLTKILFAKTSPQCICFSMR